MHVDDLPVAARTYALIRRAVRDLQQHFHVKEIGPAQWLLGIAVQRDKEAGTTVIHQHKYISDIMERFGQQDAASLNLPYAGGDKSVDRSC